MILDIIIVGFLLLAAFRGWRKGAVSMIASIVVLVLSILIATAFGTQFGRMLNMGPTLLQPVTGFFILFIILYTIGHFLKKFVTPNRGIFAGADKILGIVFSVLRAVLLLGMLFGFLRIFQLPSTKAASESAAYPIVLRAGGLMVSQLKPLVGQLSNDVYDDMTPADTIKK